VDDLYLFDLIFTFANLLGHLLICFLTSFFNLCKQLTLLGFGFSLNVKELIKEIFVLFLQQVIGAAKSLYLPQLRVKRLL
jgi:hypothetical protein